MLEVLLALLQSLPSSAPAAESRPARPQELDSRALGGLWGKSGTGIALTGPLPADPAAPISAIRPIDWITIEVPGDARAGWPAFVQRYIVNGTSPPKVGDVGLSKSSTTWESHSMPPRGELRGAFRFAYSCVRAATPGVWMARAPGAESIFVNGEGFVGDPERRGFGGVPVALSAGPNHIYVAGIRGGFELELWHPTTRLVIARWDVQYPRRPEECAKPDRWDHLVVPIFNASIDPVEYSHIHYGHARPQTEGVPNLHEWRDGHPLPPLGLITSGVFMFSSDNEADYGRNKSWLLPVSVGAHDDSDCDRAVFAFSTLPGSAVARVRRETAWPFGRRRLETARIPRDEMGYPNVCIAVGGGGSPEMKLATLGVARYLQQQLWYHADVAPPILTDEQFRSKRHGFRERVILIGNPSTNEAWVERKGDTSQLDDSTLRLGADGSARLSSDKSVSWIRAESPRALRGFYAIDLLDESTIAADVSDWWVPEAANDEVRRIR